MFNRKVTVQVELSEGAKHALALLSDDMQGLVEMISEVAKTHAMVAEMVKGEIAVLVADAAGVPVSGVHVFEGEEAELPTVVPAPEQNGKKNYPPPPGSMVTETDFSGMDEDDPNRVRQTPFTRAPRHLQVKWLMAILEDGHWHAPIEIAREVANDERHYRYLRSALGGRFREMHEEGLVLRRDSHIKGSMYEYRLKQEQ